MKLALPTIAALALTACATVEAQPAGDGVARAALGERVYVDGPHVTPLAVLDDSRCPASVQCVWAGRVRLSVKVELGSHRDIREITTQQPIAVGDGKLALVEVMPARKTPGTVRPGDYRFGFRFGGGS